jgi:serine/threonine-protein kinase RsbW
MKKSINIVVPSKREEIRNIRREIQSFLDSTTYSPDLIFNLTLALDEAVSNALDHGAAYDPDLEVEINLSIENDYLRVTVKDYGGKTFNPDYFERIAAKKDWEGGGRGIFLIKQFLDEVHYIINPGKCTLLYMGKDMTVIPEPEDDDDDEVNLNF